MMKVPLRQGGCIEQGGREGNRANEGVMMDTPATRTDTVRAPIEAVRIFVLNDHALLRQGLRDLLEHHGFEIVGESGSAAEATRLIHVLEPELVLLDDRLRDGTGIEVCRGLRATAPHVKCLILTSRDEHHAVRAAVLADAAGYVLMQVGDKDGIINSLRSAIAGKQLFMPGVRERVADSLYATASAAWLKSMTGTERSVLAFMARGLTNRQIGQEMTLPDDAVAACVSSVLQKLGFRRRGQALPVPFGNARRS